MHKLQLNYFTQMWTGFMDNLFVMFFFQVILWVIPFFLMFYLKRKDTQIRRDLKLLKDALERKKRGD